MTDLYLEGEEVQAEANADMMTQWKRPDAWAVSGDMRCLLILEFTLWCLLILDSPVQATAGA